jgi:nucleolar MIF4G domain-containing protein 1
MRFRGGVGHKSTCKATTQFLSDRHNLDLMGEGEDTEEESEEELEADGQTGTKNEGADNLEGEGEDQDDAEGEGEDEDDAEGEGNGGDERHTGESEDEAEGEAGEDLDDRDIDDDNVELEQDAVY